ncbi:MAG: replication-associated recombination protein A [Chlamydiales bacterium]|nr:replication-associated recombination protein A [Chlamydiia bacterium]MCP5508578.1 replication-associated recombination protein A [Chlamydiales bacterium]
MTAQRFVPLAESMRPKNLEEVLGQEHLTGSDGLVRLAIDKQRPLSVILWGPPGCGKTTLARVYAQAFEGRLITLSAVASGVADLKKVIAEAESQPLLQRRTFLFIDEIHRYNKAQQDLLLPYLEKGTFILVGATTENPSFSLNNALLSRTRVLTLNALSKETLDKLLVRYEEAHGPLNLDSDARSYLTHLAQGDGRYLLNLIENIQSTDTSNTLTVNTLKSLLQKRSALYDKHDEGHHNLISALHKSVRGSDPDAALYWFSRMLEGGEDPLYLARRLIRMATEDVGLADPQALPQAIAARDAYQMLGSPEGELALAQLVVYLALAPKSNALYAAYKAARATAHETAHLNPPAIILNAPTKLMKQMGYGEGYLYDHDTPHAFSGQDYFPQDLGRQQFYSPVLRGYEREMQKRIDYFQKLREKLQKA